MTTSRADCEALDAGDPIAWLRERFAIPDPGLLYMDGNSLGRPSTATLDALDGLLHDGWARGLVGSWEDWIDLPLLVGDELGAAFLGAAAGQVVVCDGITLNLYKAVRAALDLRPGRGTIVLDPDDFPTDRYVLAGIAADRGLALRPVASDIDAGLSLDALDDALDDDVAVVCLSLVAYRSGALVDLAEATRRIHAAGALAVWDLSHATGAVPVDLDAAGVDLAVGCTYKYLNGGPGSTGFLYAAQRLHEGLANPIQGWMGQRDRFAMGDGYDPLPGVGRFLTGTQPIPSIVAVRAGVATLAEAGVDALRAKGVALTEMLVALHDERLAPLGFRLATPRDPARRGSHVTVEHPRALAVSQALRRRGVVPDVRTPDRLRFGPAPAYTRFVDVWDAVEAVCDVVASGEHELDVAAPSVT